MTKRKEKANTKEKWCRWSEPPVLHDGSFPTEKDLHELGDLELAWAQETDSLTIGEFKAKYRLTWNAFSRYLDRSDYLRNCHEIAKAIIGSRRERGALLGMMNASIVERTMPLYDAEYKSLIEWRSRLGAEVEEQKNRIVVIEKMPESSMVPLRKRDV